MCLRRRKPMRWLNKTTFFLFFVCPTRSEPQIYPISMGLSHFLVFVFVGWKHQTLDEWTTDPPIHVQNQLRQGRGMIDLVESSPTRWELHPHWERHPVCEGIQFVEEGHRLVGATAGEWYSMSLYTLLPNLWVKLQLRLKINLTGCCSASPVHAWLVSMRLAHSTSY